MRIASIRRARLTLIALVAGLLVPAAALSDDFTFTVPVDVRSLSSNANTGRPGVQCEVWSVVPAPPPAPITGTRLAVGDMTFALTNGGFQGNVTVHFNAPSIAALTNAKGYRCWLFLDQVDRFVELGTLGHRQGTTFTPEVRGALNP